MDYAANRVRSFIKVIQYNYGLGHKLIGKVYHFYNAVLLKCFVLLRRPRFLFLCRILSTAGSLSQKIEMPR